MNVLHITNEFSKKNFSISSLILFITSYLNKNYNFNYSIITSLLEENLFSKKNINIIDFSKWFDFLFNRQNLKKKILSYEIVHIHGIWAPIQFISLLICNSNKVKCFVHPHGMLLNEALKSAGIFKFILKRFSLYLLKFLIKNNIKFISITNQETLAINKYFPKSNITEISNPIPFEIDHITNDNKQKKMVYFGRIHPHKNIHLLIKAFIKAKLSNDWKLEIFGIRDDEKYFKSLNKLISSNDKIEIKNPVFGKEKQEIMRSAWFNILVSKSEVLSLSILESSMHGLPSLVNKDIETKGMSDSIISTELGLESLKNKIEEISLWTKQKRISLGNKISENVKIKTSIEKISSQYNHLYNYEIIETNIEDKGLSTDLSFFNLVRKNLNFLIISNVYMFNLMFASLVVVALVVLGHYSIAGELGLVISFWITLTQIFSSNMRSIVVSEDNNSYALMTLVYRTLFSLISLSLFFYISDIFFSFENKGLISSISILIMVQWINEMNLVQNEIKNKIKLFKFFSLLNILTVIIASIMLYHSKFLVLNLLIYIYILLITFLFSRHFIVFFINIKKYSLDKIIKLNIKTIAFLSSFSIIISSFAWRIMIFYIFDKSLAGIFFACFSMGSFPGTLFNSVIGPAFVRQKIRIPQVILNVFFIIFIIIVIGFVWSAYTILNLTNINYLAFEFVLFTISLSLIGSYFMSYAMYLRHKKIQSTIEERTYLFRRDVFYGISITFVIPLLYYLGSTVAVSFSFIIASLSAILSYSINFSENKKINFKF